MIRLFIIAICAVVVVVVGIVVWNATTEPEAPTVTPERQHYNLEGGQDMRPRLRSNEGGADGTSGN